MSDETSTQQSQVTEDQSRQVAEQSRQKKWKGKSFLRQLFLGNLHVDWLADAPDYEERPEFVEFCRKLKRFLEEEVDSAAIDASGEYPQHVIDGLAEMGAFGMKIGREYDGLGFSQPEYSKALEIVGEYDSNLVALLSAHQSIGVPQPVKLFGTDAQKKKYLPLCATGGVSAFALTEPDVGSDPARIHTSYRESDDGEAFIIDGQKLWCTNGSIADVLVVMARNEETDKISAFIVDADSEGFSVTQRCRFMGLRALENAALEFDGVRVPKENLIGNEGEGLKIALVTLNTGRLSLPAATVGTAKKALEYAREFAAERVQWGAPVGKHEAVAQMIADIASRAFAMEAISDLASQLATQEDYDIRLAAAVAKEWNSTRQWDALDDLLQVRGGRGYETEHSLAARGEQPVPTERMLRDARINRIFEGSSEIMHLFIAREALDKHLDVAGVMVEDSTIGEKLKALPAIMWFYARWYTAQWVGWSGWPKYSEYGKLAKHVRFADRMSSRLARNLFHGMMRYQAKLEKKQAFLFRGVDIAMELFAMVASVVRARRMKEQGHPDAELAVELADLICREGRRRCELWLYRMWHNEDVRKYKLAQKVLDGDYAFLEAEPVDTTDWRQAPVPEAGRRPEPRRDRGGVEEEKRKDKDRGTTAA